MTTLGPLDSSHLEKIRSWRNDIRVRKWCRQHSFISDIDQSRWFERVSNDPTIKMFGVYAGSEIVGVCGLTSIDLVNRRAEFSLYIGPEHHGNGYGTLALVALFSHGFHNWGLNTIWGESFDDNPAMKTFEKIGMKKDGIRRQFYFRDGKFINAHLYSITRDEFSHQWLAAKST